MPRILPGLAVSLLVFATLISAQNSETEAAQFFDDRVEPILSKRCLGCHNEELKDGGISFQDRESLIKGGSRGPAIVPGKPAESVLIHAVRQDGELKMPPGAKLSAQDLATLAEWIERGAIWGTKLRAR
jgi:cytochrome c551/c552